MPMFMCQLYSKTDTHNQGWNEGTVLLDVKKVKSNFQLSQNSGYVCVLACLALHMSDYQHFLVVIRCNLLVVT